MYINHMYSNNYTILLICIIVMIIKLGQTSQLALECPRKRRFPPISSPENAGV